MAEIEIVEKDYFFGADMLGDYDSYPLDIMTLVEKRLEAIRDQIATGIEAKMQKALEDIVTHTTAEMRGKDVHICFWDGTRTLLAWKTIPEAELVRDDDSDELEENEVAGS